jgi:hypothetical protein
VARSLGFAALAIKRGDGQAVPNELATVEVEYVINHLTHIGLKTQYFGPRNQDSPAART